MSNLWLNVHFAYWKIQCGGDKWWHVKISKLDFRFAIHNIGSIVF